MASAFLLSGAALVIAPDELVDNQIAVAFADELYRQPPTPGPRAARMLIEALARAQAADADHGPWRAWVR
jgi:hypothetical protein